MSLRDVSGGPVLGSLEALRDDLAVKLDMCGSMRDYAALSARYLDVLKRIDEKVAGPAGASGSPESAVDEFTQARNRRRGSA